MTLTPEQIEKLALDIFNLTQTGGGFKNPAEVQAMIQAAGAPPAE